MPDVKEESMFYLILTVVIISVTLFVILNYVTGGGFFEFITRGMLAFFPTGISQMAANQVLGS